MRSQLVNLYIYVKYLLLVARKSCTVCFSFLTFIVLNIIFFDGVLELKAKHSQCSIATTILQQNISNHEKAVACFRISLGSLPQ